MGKSLIIVESPTKVKTIKKFLGPGYTVQASVGHIRDLPKNCIGVDEANDFAPQYEIIQGKEKIVQSLRDAAMKADTVYLAPDPDREGEAIAWHIAEILKDINPNIKRIQFNEITSRAVRDALKHPRELDANLFDAQQARRVLDRLVGYKLSPLLWKTIKRGISAGRVQSVALRLIVEREEKRCAFVPEEYWVFKALLCGETPPSFKADIWKISSKKPSIPDRDSANALAKTIHSHPFIVTAVDETERNRAPQPPFITSTLQQAANQRLGYPAKQTMRIAQRLYEGIELDDRGTTALITYMRTDSVRIASTAQNATAAFIEQRFGKDFLAPGGKRIFKTKPNAQDAHEAIRPVDVNLTPEAVRHSLSQEQYQIYRLIWSRFVASQMASARLHSTTITINNGPVQWRTKGMRVVFPGFLVVLPDAADEVNEEFPPLKVGEELKLTQLNQEQKFTQPAPRFTEASLVRELEELGIGRPSTYSAIISTLQDRDYVRLEDKHFAPTDLGQMVCDRLREHFKTLMDVGFTAHMEESLDKIADGEQNWIALLHNFNDNFDPTLRNAVQTMHKTDAITTVPCPNCGKPLVIKFGKTGQFLACSGYPDCHYTSNYSRDAQGQINLVEKIKPTFEKVGTCPECGRDLVLKKARTGSRFIACSGYPECKHMEPFSTGVPCPQKNCDGMLVERSSKRGKLFYACSNYPKCNYALWNFPVQETCPKCGFPLLVLKETVSKGKFMACPCKGCTYTQPYKSTSHSAN